MSLRMEQARIGDGSPLAGRTLAQAAIPQQTGLIVLAMRKEVDEPGEHDFVFNPVAETRLDSGDELIVLGTREQIDELRRYVRA
jgi:voltage-gated potassium channel